MTYLLLVTNYYKWFTVVVKLFRKKDDDTIAANAFEQAVVLGTLRENAFSF